MATTLMAGGESLFHEPSENWDDDFEFNASTPAQSSSPSSSRPPQSTRARGTASGAAGLRARMSMASSEFTMEDWDADSVIAATPPRLRANVGYHTPTKRTTGENVESEDEDLEDEASPTIRRTLDGYPGGTIPISLALAAWSDEPPLRKSLDLSPTRLTTTTAPGGMGVGLVASGPAENWDDDFAEDDAALNIQLLQQKKRLDDDDEHAHESWDDEFAAEEQQELGMGPPPGHRKSPTNTRHLSSSSESECEDQAQRFGAARQRKRGNSQKSAIQYHSQSEDGDFYDSSEDEFGVKRGEEGEEDRTVTARSRKGFARLMNEDKPPPVPRLPPFLAIPTTSPSSPTPHSGSTISARSPFLQPSPPTTFLGEASSPRPFPRSPTPSSVFSVPTTVTSTTHLNPSLSRMSPPQKERERRRLRKKSRPTAGVMEMSGLQRRGSGRAAPRRSGDSGLSGGYGYSFSDGELEDIREREREREDEEGAGDRILPRRATTPSPSPTQGPDSSPFLGVDGEGRLEERNGGLRPPETPSKGSTLLSRIGSVTSKWREARRKKDRERHGEATSTIDTSTMTPRAQSSMSSLHLHPQSDSTTPPSLPPNHKISPGAFSLVSVASSSSSPHFHHASPSRQGQGPSSWFFRSASNHSGASSSSAASHDASGAGHVRYNNRRFAGARKSVGDGIPNRTTGPGLARSLGGADDEGEYASSSENDQGDERIGGGSRRESWAADVNRTPIATPSRAGGGGDDQQAKREFAKLMKKKSLGFMQLGRAGAVVADANTSTPTRTRRSGINGKRKSEGGAPSGSGEREWPAGDGHGDCRNDPFLSSAVPFGESNPSLLSANSVGFATPMPSKEKDKEKEKEKEKASRGLRQSILGNVRRLSIVTAAASVTTSYRHKRTQSSSAAVNGGASGTPSPSALEAAAARARASLNIRPGSRGGMRTPTPTMGRVAMVREASGSSAGSGSGSGRPLTPSTSVPALQKVYNDGGSVGRGNLHRRKRSGTVTAGDFGRRVSNKENFEGMDWSWDGDGGGAKGNVDAREEKPKDDVEEGASRGMGTKEEVLLPPIELQPPSPPRASTTARENERGLISGVDLVLGSQSDHLDATKLSASGPPQTPSSSRKRNPHSPQSASVGRASPLTPPSAIDFGPKRKISAVGLGLGIGRSPSTHDLDQSVSSNATTLKGDASTQFSTGGEVAEGKGAVNAVKAREAAVLRRNSLGDLKIPARISQAQVSLRRDLGLVREFAHAVEDLKNLQDTYNDLNASIHTLLDKRAKEAAEASRQEQTSPTPVPTNSDAPDAPLERSGSTKGAFFNLANLSRTHLGLGRKGRKRSSTNPEGMMVPPTSMSLDVPTAIRTSFPGRSSSNLLVVKDTEQQSSTSHTVYKELASELYGINSRYKISWECAELLIELGGGSSSKDNEPGAAASSSTLPHANPGASASAVALSQVPAATDPVASPKMHKRTTSKSSTRERAVTLAGDERSRPNTPIGAGAPRPGSRVGSYGTTSSVHSYAPSMSSPLHGGGQATAPVTASASMPVVGATQTNSPPLASPTSGWRASTGRHDLSQRQLSLLKEMLNNDSNSIGRSHTDFDEKSHEAPRSVNPSRLSIAEEPDHAKGSPLSPDREWRWGADAMGSTVTLPGSEEHEEGGTGGTERAGSRMSGVISGGVSKPKKKKLMNMSGFRDMLRALRRGGGIAVPHVDQDNQSPTQAQGQQALLARTKAGAASTTSLSAGSSHDGHSSHGHRHSQPQQIQPQRKYIQKKRPKSSAGPEEILAFQQQMKAGASSSALHSPPLAPTSHLSPSPPSAFSMPMSMPPKSPRRPSLASIFKIGTSNKTAPPPRSYQSGNATDSSGSFLGDENTRYIRRGYGGGVDGDDDEEDWDQIDSASDLDGVAGVVAGIDMTATIRGVASSHPRLLEKKRKKRLVVVGNAAGTGEDVKGEERDGKTSPYLQQDPYAHRSGSRMGRRVVSASAVSPASASSTSFTTNASQVSLDKSVKEAAPATGSGATTSGSGNNGTTISANGSVRQAKLSDVQENEAGEAATRASASLSRQTGKQAAFTARSPSTAHPPPGGRSVSTSSRLSKLDKTGSVRSMPPQPFSPSSISSGSNMTSPYMGSGGGGATGPNQYPDIKLTFTPENIKPLLENAKEVQKRLRECLEEMRRLVKREEERCMSVGVVEGGQVALDPLPQART